MHFRLSSMDIARFFFQPVQLHFEPADLLIQRRCERIWINFRSRSAKDLRNPLEQLSLPLANLNRSHFMLAGQLVYGLIPFVGFQCYLGLELGLVSFFFAVMTSS